MEAKADKDSVRVGFEIGRAELLQQMAQLALDRMFRKYSGGSYDEEPYDYVDDSELGKLLRDEVRKTIRARVEERVQAITDERIGAELDQLLAEGWTKTDNYGRPTGSKFTLRDHALSLLTTTDSYNRESYVDRSCREHVQEALSKTLKPEIDALKAKAKDALNSGFEAAIRVALAQGAGLKI